MVLYEKEEITMLDELRIKLGGSFMKGIVSKLISKAIYKKYGYKVTIKLDELDIWSIDGDTSIKLNAELKMNSQEFKKFIKEFDD